MTIAAPPWLARTTARGGLTGSRWESLAAGLAERLWPEYTTQREQAEVADTWLRGENEIPTLPDTQWAPDYKELQKASPSNYIRVALAQMTQCLYVEGHVPSSDRRQALSRGESGGPARAQSEVWNRIWQPNRMDGRQIAVHRSAMAHGVAYVVAEKAKVSFSNEETVSLRGVSAMSGCALWRTTEVQEFPECFIEVQSDRDEDGNEIDVVQIYDEEWIYTLHRYEQSHARDRSEWIPIDRRKHGASVVPVVAFCNDEDLDGQTQGEIIPVIPILKRVDQDTFDRLIVQRFGSWRIRTASGIQLPDEKDQEAVDRLNRYLSVNSILTSENENAKFGTLEPTQLEGYIASKDADLRDFATVTQIPPHHMLGLSPNVSAEGLVIAQAGLMRKMEERQHLFGESWELLMRLASHMLGMKEAASDFGSQVTWRDMESRSLSQVADALGKVAEMLEVPTELLWNRLPNWSQQDTEMALELREREREDAEAMLLAEAQASLAGSGSGGSSSSGGSVGGTGLSEAEQRRINRLRGGYGPDWDGDGKPN